MIRPSHAARACRLACLAALTAALALPTASAQHPFQPDPSGTISGAVETTDPVPALAFMQMAMERFGDPVGSTESEPPQAYLGACPPVGAIVTNQQFPFSFEATAVAEPDGGDVFVEVEITVCTIISTDPCLVQRHEIFLIWDDLSYGQVFDALVGNPTPTEPPPTPPSTGGNPGGGVEDPGSGGATSTSGGYSAQYSASNGDGCHRFTIIVTPWGQVMTGTEFAAEYPDHVAGFLAQIAARIHPTPLDPECVTFGDP